MTDDEEKRRWREKSPYLVAVDPDSRSDARHVAESVLRNCGPILEVLDGRLPASGRALELASGTGQHVVAFAEAFPGIAWQPSDRDPVARASIAAWRRHAGLANIENPLEIDLLADAWWAALTGPFDVMVAINLIHISPWAVAESLLAGAARLLDADGLLFIYGCFMREGQHVSPSNAEFDRSLKFRNPAWGTRDCAEMARAAEAVGLRLDEILAMPANNTSLVIRRAGA
jgi:hypothetical protein